MRLGAFSFDYSPLNQTCPDQIFTLHLIDPQNDRHDDHRQQDNDSIAAGQIALVLRGKEDDDRRA